MDGAGEAELWADRGTNQLAGRTDLVGATRRRARPDGRTNKEVDAALVVSVHTVEAALTQIYRKLDIRSRTELARRLPPAKLTKD